MPCGKQTSQPNTGYANCGKCGKLCDIKDLTIKHTQGCGLLCKECKEKYE